LPFGQGGRVGVALHNNRSVQLRLHLIFEHERVEARQVWRPVKSTGGQLERAGSTDSHAKQFVTWSALFEDAADRVAHVLHHSPRTVRHAGGHIDEGQTLPLRVEGGDPQIGAPEVDADREPALLVTRRWWCAILPDQTVPPLPWNSDFLTLTSRREAGYSISRASRVTINSSCAASSVG